MMKKLEQLKSVMRSQQGQDSALWYSGGKDSRLLLEIVHSENLQYSVLRFDDGWTTSQKRLAYDQARGVVLYTYRAADFMMLGNEENLSLAAFYPIDQNTYMPLLKDFVPGDRHIEDIKLEYGEVLPVRFTTHLVGSRRSDRHYAVGDRPTAPGGNWQVGSCTVLAPLYDWSDREVLEALACVGAEYVPPPTDELDTGNIPICSDCLSALHEGRTSCTNDEQVWDPKQNLQQFQQMIGAT